MAETGGSSGGSSSETPLGPAALLFFPPKEFSARYGPGFFSASVQNFELEDGVCSNSALCCWPTATNAVYLVRVTAGRNEWTVRRRFRDFHKLLLSEPNKDWAPPPKTLFPSLEEAFLRQRQLLLDKCLTSFLKARSRTDPHAIMASPEVVAFLDLGRIG